MAETEIPGDLEKGQKTPRPTSGTADGSDKQARKPLDQGRWGNNSGSRKYNDIRTDKYVNLEVPVELFDGMSDAQINRSLLELAERYQREVSYM